MNKLRWTAALLLVAAASAHAQDRIGAWKTQSSGTKERLRGISVVSSQVAWASGTHGTFVRTVDGESWKPGQVAGAESLDFRDVHAVDADTAYLMAAGAGELSRIYKTTDGGKSWALQLTNPDKSGFFDAMAFWSPDEGILMGDPVDGKFVVYMTSDGGKTWTRPNPDRMPSALPGEGGFAASGTCLVAGKIGKAWFGTGGAKTARVFRSEDRGKTWTVADTPVRAGNATSGIFSLAIQPDGKGVAVGGDYKEPNLSESNAAITSDDGKTWRPVDGTRPRGYRSAVACVRINEWIAAGPSGMEGSSDAGESWSGGRSYGVNAIGFEPGASPGWGVGDAGLIVHVRPNRM